MICQIIRLNNRWIMNYIDNLLNNFLTINPTTNLIKNTICVLTCNFHPLIHYARCVVCVLVETSDSCNQHDSLVFNF